MEFYDPIVAQEELPKTEAVNDNKTEDAVHKLEDEIDHAYSAVEARFAGLWSSASKNASGLQEKYKLEEHKNQLLEQLSSAKKNINNRAKVTESLGQIEDQLKALSGHMPEIDMKNLQQHATSTLDSLDSTLELVEKQAGKYVSQLTSFFSGIVAVNPDNHEEESVATIFKAPLNDKENYGTSRYDNDLYNLHTTASTYTSDEMDNKKEIEKFSADSKTDEIARLLEDYPTTLTKLMNDLVPVKVSYELFWYRYFKAEAKLKEFEQKRKELLKRKENKDVGDKNEDDDFAWDDDEDDEDVVDVGKDAKEVKGAKVSQKNAQLQNKKQESSVKAQEKSNADEDDDDDDWE